MPFLRILLVVWFATFNLLPVCSQESYRVTTYGKEDGLQSELVKSVAIDNWGFLWLATDEGIIRFNGYRFLQYRDELPSPYVKSVICTKKGELFATTDLGFVRINATPYHASFETIIEGKTTETDSLLWFPKQLYEDKRGAVWFSDNTAIYCYENKKINRIKLPTSDNSYNWQRACSFVENEKNELFIFTEQGYLYRYDRHSDLLSAIYLKKPLGSINHALRVKDDQYLVSAQNDLFLTEIAEGKFRKIDEIKGLDIAHFALQKEGEVLAGSWSKGLFSIHVENQTIAAEPIRDYPIKAANFLFSTSEGKTWITSDNGLRLIQPKVFSSILQQQTDKYIQDLDIKNGSFLFSDGNTVFSGKKTNEEITKTSPVFSTKNETIIQLGIEEKGFCYTNNMANLVFVKKGKVTQRIDFSETGQTIFSLLKKDDSYWMCQDGNKSLIHYNPNGEKKYFGKQEGLTGRPVVARVSPQGELFVGCIGNDSYFFKFDDATGRFINLSQSIQKAHTDDVILTDIAFDHEENAIWLGTSIGLFRYSDLRIEPIDLGSMGREAVKALVIDKQNHLWVANSRGLVRYHDKGYVVFDEREGLPSKTISYRVLRCDSENWIWVGTVAGLGYTNKHLESQLTPDPLLLSVRNNDIRVDFSDEGHFLANSFFNIQFICPSYPFQTVSFQWRIIGRDTTWLNNGRSNELQFSNLPVGSYQLQIRALQDGDYLWSAPITYSFRTARPWYFRVSTWVLFLFFLSTLVVTIIKINTYKLRIEKQHLEAKVEERTSEILASKRKLEHSQQELKDTLSVLEITNNYLQSQTWALNTTAIVSMTDAEGYIISANDNFCTLSGYQRAELLGAKHSILKSGVHNKDFYNNMWKTIQKTNWRGEVCNRKKDGELYWVDATIVPFMDEDEKPYQYLAIRIDITEQKRTQNQLQKTNEEILSSIEYASFIQKALLPPFDQLKDIVTDHFVFHLPRDVVSGDFYWAKKIGTKRLIATVDCTGHGVPGAMMSMLGIAFLNEISAATPKDELKPNYFLDQLRKLVKTSLRQTNMRGEQQDGMDMSMCVFDDEERTLLYAGAHLPIYIVKNGELTEFSPTPNPISVYRKEIPFQCQHIDLPTDAMVYMFSDGFVDQFGGEHNQKFMTKRFKNLFTSISDLEVAKQKDKIAETFANWTKNSKQIDDVLVIGVRF